MAGMKVAISLPDPVFRAAETLARKLRKSRSQLYAEAIAEYVGARGAKALTARLNPRSTARNPRRSIRRSSTRNSSACAVKRGEIWWASLPPPSGSGPGFRKPVLVIQYDAFNESRIATAVVAVITSNLALAEAPGNVRTRQSGDRPAQTVCRKCLAATDDRPIVIDGSRASPAREHHGARRQRIAARAWTVGALQKTFRPERFSGDPPGHSRARAHPMSHPRVPQSGDVPGRPHRLPPGRRRVVSQPFPEPTEAQARAWAVTSQHRNALIAAPTGSGKTLAAFLSAINDLVVEGSRRACRTRSTSSTSRR